MLSIKVLMGLVSVIACHSVVIVSRSPRLDFSLALAPGTAPMVGAWLPPCSRASKLSLFLLPLLGLAIWATSILSLQPFLGFHSERVPKPMQQQKRKGEEMFGHSPASSFPLRCTGTAEGWHQDKNGKVLGERCGSLQGGKGTHWELVSSRLALS